MNILAEAAGYIAGLCIATCFLPQTLRTIRSKNVQELSLTSYVIYWENNCCLLGFLRHLSAFGADDSV